MSIKSIIEEIEKKEVKEEQETRTSPVYARDLVQALRVQYRDEEDRLGEDQDLVVGYFIQPTYAE